MISLFIIALLTLGAAAAAMMLRQLIHSVLLLIGAWAGIAAFYLWAGSEFVAFAQLLVYVGAVSMVVLFAVLLTRQSRTDVSIPPESGRRGFAAVLVGGAVFALLTAAVLRTELPVASPVERSAITVHELGMRLMGSHAAALLVVGVILTVALLGGVVVASGERPAEKEDVP